MTLFHPWVAAETAEQFYEHPRVCSKLVDYSLPGTFVTVFVQILPVEFAGWNCSVWLSQVDSSATRAESADLLTDYEDSLLKNQYLNVTWYLQTVIISYIHHLLIQLNIWNTIYLLDRYRALLLRHVLLRNKAKNWMSVKALLRSTSNSRNKKYLKVWKYAKRLNICQVWQYQEYKSYSIIKTERWAQAEHFHYQIKYTIVSNQSLVIGEHTVTSECNPSHVTWR